MSYILTVMGVDKEHAATLTLDDVAFCLDSGRILACDGLGGLIDMPANWQGLYYRSGNTYGFSYHCTMNHEQAYMAVNARSPFDAVQKLSRRLATNNQFWLSRCA